MNDKRLFWTLMILLVVSIMSVAVFARPPLSVCCASPDSCVASETCFSPGYHSDIDGDGDGDYCGGGEWWDCGAGGSTTGCNAGEVCNENHDCIPIVDICFSCDKDYECDGDLFCSGGVCKETTNEAGAMCSDGLDNDCDGLTDCQGSGDPGCNCCGTEGNECCTVGDDCTGSLYCADGGSDADHCCAIGAFWNDATNACQDADPCGLGGTQASDGLCYVDITTNLLGWLADPDCYQGSEGCCEVYQYGEWNYYPEDITTY